MFEIVLRIGFSLLVVFGLMWAMAKVARRPLSGNRGTGTLAVLNRQQLSRGSSVAIVQVAGRALILGVTENQVNLLGETELEAFEKHPHEHREGIALSVDQGRPRTLGSLLERIRDRTTRN